MKRIFIFLTLLSAVLSCQKVVIERNADGAISVQVDNKPTVEVVTKSETVSTDDFNVYVKGPDNYSKTYIYKDMDPVLYVPAGSYYVESDNCTKEKSLEGWGLRRYHGKSETKEVKSEQTTSFAVTCSMVNTAVSVNFTGNFDRFMSEGYILTVYTSDATSRKLEFTKENTTSTTPAVGYFYPDAKLKYSFTGKDKDGQDIVPIEGELDILKAKHYNLNIKIKGDYDNGLKPEITVDTTCETLETDIEIDPTEDDTK